MAQKRFLRDGVLEGLIHYVEEYLHSIPENDEQFQFHYVNSVLVAFKTSKVALERIEESIEFARRNDPTGEICSPLAEAAMHIQTGILSLHETLQNSTSGKEDEISLSDLS